MKKLMMIALAFMTLTATAQRNSRAPKNDKKGDKVSLSATDQATIQTKKMTLALVLNKDQADQVYQLNLQQAKKRLALREERDKAKDSQPTPEQRQAAREARLDDRIAIQNEMQKILTEDQFKLWRKINQKRRKEFRKGKGEGSTRFMH